MMEYCELGCMLNFIPEDGMHVGEAQRLFTQVVSCLSSFAFLKSKRLPRFPPQLSAVAYLHALGIVHEDIKPDNILIDAGGVAKLGDFGMAERVGEVRMMSNVKCAFIGSTIPIRF